jgi:formyl-CoA transferase
MGAPSYYTAYGGEELTRSGAAHATIAPYELFTSGDGVEIYLAVQNDREWVRFCNEVLEHPELGHDPRFASNAMRVLHRPLLHAMISKVFAGLPEAVILDRLETASVASARRNPVSAFIEHPQLAERDRWRTIDSPGGPIRALLPPAMMDGVEPVMGPVPALGQHTQEILEELGYDADTIKTWRRERVV